MTRGVYTQLAFAWARLVHASQMPVGFTPAGAAIAPAAPACHQLWGLAFKPYLVEIANTFGSHRRRARRCAHIATLRHFAMITSQ